MLIACKLVGNLPNWQPDKQWSVLQVLVSIPRELTKQQFWYNPIGKVIRECSKGNVMLCRCYMVGGHSTSLQKIFSFKSKFLILYRCSFDVFICLHSVCRSYSYNILYMLKTITGREGVRLTKGRRQGLLEEVWSCPSVLQSARGAAVTDP